MTDEFKRSYNSFSGVDMIVTLGGIWIGELQGISYSVTREKAPTYTMGNANPRAFSRGKRGISGALVFAVFDRSAMLRALTQTERQHYKKNSPIIAAAKPGGLVDENFSQKADNAYADQILPFNIRINGANEYGQSTNMEISGIELLQFGSGMSIDDIQTNESYSFLAIDMKPYKATAEKSAGTTVTQE